MPMTGVLTGGTYNNIEDYLKATGNNENGLGMITREMYSPFGWSSLLPYTVCTMDNDGNRFVDRAIYRVPYEYDTASVKALIDEDGVQRTYDTYRTEDPMAMRKIARKVYKDQVRANVSEMEMQRYQGLAMQVADARHDIEIDMLYDDPSKDARNCYGLYPRFDAITDRYGVIQNGTDKGKVKRFITIDAGGTGTSLTSMFLFIPGGNAVTRLVPAPGTDFLPIVKVDMGHRTLGEKWDFEGQKEYTWDKADVVFGLGIRNRGACIRIANIDLGTSNVETAMMNFRKAFRRAFAALDVNLRGSGVYAMANSELLIEMADFFDVKGMENKMTTVEQNGIPMMQSIDFPMTSFVYNDDITIKEDKVE